LAALVAVAGAGPEIALALLGHERLCRRRGMKSNRPFVTMHRLNLWILRRTLSLKAMEFFLPQLP
jgi:hypothetical protein